MDIVAPVNSKWGSKQQIPARSGYQKPAPWYFLREQEGLIVLKNKQKKQHATFTHSGKSVQYLKILMQNILKAWKGRQDSKTRHLGL